MPGASVYVSEPQTIKSGGTGLPVQFVVQSPDIEYLREIIDPFLEEVRANPIFTFADVNLKFNRPEMLVEIDRNRARYLAATSRDVAEKLQISYAACRYGYFTMER